MEVLQNKTLGVIPARYKSSRFPGKPLALILGKSLLQRTYENALCCAALDDLIVATDDERIATHVKEFGGKVVMTSSQCQTGTDRCAEAATHFPEYQRVVNIQGDEPCLEPEVIAEMALHSGAMVTAATPILKTKDFFDPGIVKCVFDLKGRALYFTRAPILHAFRHLGVYAFDRGTLLEYRDLPQTPLQKAEDLEQLKALEHGTQIHVCVVEDQGIGVDTPEDLKRLEEKLCKENTSLSQEALSLP